VERLILHPVFDQLWSLSIHLMASISLISPKCLWVVARLLWRKMILLTISRGVPARDAYVAANLLRVSDEIEKGGQERISEFLSCLLCPVGDIFQK